MITVEGEKDLVVLFSSTLKFNHHLKEIVYRLLGLIKRTFNFLEPCTDAVQALRCTDKRDYACVIWISYQLGDIRTLERVQRSAIRACSSLRHLPYNDRLVALNLSSLMYRRRRIHMIMMYKMEIFLFAVDLNNLAQEVMESDDVWTLKSKLDIYWKHYRFSYS